MKLVTLILHMYNIIQQTILTLGSWIFTLISVFCVIPSEVYVLAGKNYSINDSNGNIVKIWNLQV